MRFISPNDERALGWLPLKGQWGRRLSNRPLAESHDEDEILPIPRAFVQLCFYGRTVSVAAAGLFDRLAKEA